MTAVAGARDSATLDLVGVGFGPSNLALAIALREAEPAEPVRSLFLEKQAGFGWHRGMLIEGTTMQVSFLKDLVTLRTPTSDFSFLAYLHDKGRLVDFVNHQVLMPSRHEFHDYLGWAAGRLGHLVRYGVEVAGVRAVPADGATTELEVLGRVAGGQPEPLCRTRNLVIAAGLRPSLPEGVATGEQIWHSSQFLHRLSEWDDREGRPPRRVVVVGAGQSAAEIAAHVMERYRESEVCAVFARYGYSVADASPFANRVFDPVAVDDFYFAPPAVRASLLRYHANTNYSVVDADLLADLYRRQYEQNITGTSRLRVLHVSRVVSAEPGPDGVAVRVEFLPSGETSDLDADVVIYATGYTPADPVDLLAGIGGSLRRDEQGRPLIGRDFRLSTAADLCCGIYVQGPTEASHGITSTLLSTTAVRAGEIAKSVSAALVEHRRLPAAGNRG